CDVRCEVRCGDGRWGCFFFSSRRRHTRLVSDWSSDVCSSDLYENMWRGVGGPDGVMFVSTIVPELKQYEGRTIADIARMQNKQQIGRASCRERGESTVGGASLKKKKRRQCAARQHTNAES